MSRGSRRARREQRREQKKQKKQRYDTPKQQQKVPHAKTYHAPKKVVTPRRSVDDISTDLFGGYYCLARDAIGQDNNANSEVHVQSTSGSSAS